MNQIFTCSACRTALYFPTLRLIYLLVFMVTSGCELMDFWPLARGDKNQQEERFLSSAGEEMRYGIPLTEKDLADLPGHPLVDHYQEAQLLTTNNSQPEKSLDVSIKPSSLCTGELTTYYMDKCVRLARFYIWHKTSSTKDVTNMITESVITSYSERPSKCSDYPCQQALLSDAFYYSQQSFLALYPGANNDGIMNHLYPIYVLHSPENHQYLTRSLKEKQDLMSRRNYQDRGILFYTASGKSFGNTEIYRFVLSKKKVLFAQGPWSYMLAYFSHPYSLDAHLGSVLVNDETN
ncbi:MAG: hypothetical protein OXC40_00310 [Proteobacteria bacterium]|nr:hypothetical protein [Pseudomonadota bacterium]